MNAMDRLWSLGAGLVAIAVVAGAWFGTVSPSLDDAATADSDRSNVEMQNSIHETRLAGLEEAASRMGEFAAARDELTEGIPADVEYAAFLREVQRLAAETGVVLQAVTTGEAMLYVSPVEEAPEPEAEPEAESDAATEAETESTDGAEQTTDAAADSAAATQVTAADGELPAPVPYSDPLISPDNFAAIPVSVSAEGEADALFEFLRRLQTGARLISVSTVSVVDATESEPARLDTSGYLYALHGQEASTAP